MKKMLTKVNHLQFSIRQFVWLQVYTVNDITSLKQHDKNCLTYRRRS